MKTLLLTFSLTVGSAALASGTLAAQKTDRDVITRAELLKAVQKLPDLYNAILALRPHFIAALPLRSTDPRAQMKKALVLVDGNRSGDVSVLRGMSTQSVEEVRYLTPAAATLEYGSDAAGGAIVVTLHKDPKS